MTTTSPETLTAAAHRYLWMHFTPMTSDPAADVPVIVRGEGAWVYDQNGKRYLDGLAGLFVSQVGHGRNELADAAAEQARKLAYFPVWSYAHPGAIELAERLADLAPGDLERVFFTTGGGEAVESAWKLARQYFQAIGQPHRYKVIGRHIAYHGTTMGALSITGVPSIKAPFEPLVPGAVRVVNTNPYRPAPIDPAEAIALAIEMEGPESVAAVFLEPFQNSGGCFPPPAGYFYGIELVKDKATRASFNPEESERLLRGFLSRALYDAGLICRADDRGDPVVQLAPPLIIGQPEFDYIEQVLRTVLTEAWARI